MRPAFLAIASGLLLVVAACNRDADKVEPPKLGEAFPNVLIPPQGRLESRSGSVDAVQLTFMTPAKPDQVAHYYRDQFSRVGWTIVGDVTDTTGVVSIHVNWDKTDQPMWVQIAPLAGGSQVDLAGAVPGRDTAYVHREKTAEDSSNTFVPR